MLLLFLVSNLNRKKIYFEFLVFFTKIMELIKEDTGRNNNQFSSSLFWDGQRNILKLIMNSAIQNKQKKIIFEDLKVVFNLRNSFRY